MMIDMGFIRKMTVYIPLITVVLISSIWIHESVHIFQHSNDNITEMCYFGRSEGGAIGWVEYYPSNITQDDISRKSNESPAQALQLIYNVVFDCSLLYFIMLRDDWVP
jgi:hypothetical protein